MEKIWRSESIDYKLFFCGHCNTTTDIKEANFFGRLFDISLFHCLIEYVSNKWFLTKLIVRSNAQFIVAGSDDGSFFIWDRNTTNIIKVLKGDDSIVNCLQPHPSTCLLATSGIENTVRLWSPRPEVLNQCWNNFKYKIFCVTCRMQMKIERWRKWTWLPVWTKRGCELIPLRWCWWTWPAGHQIETRTRACRLLLAAKVNLTCIKSATDISWKDLNF